MPENNTPTCPSVPPTSAALAPSSVPPAGGDRRVSMAEIAAFVAETKRMLNGGSASLADRLAFFEWKADLFTRLGETESAEAAAVEAARLRAQLDSESGASGRGTV